MVPATIQNLLHRLRRRDFWLALSHAAGCAVAVVVAAVLVGGLIDWLVDRWIDTPATVRGLLYVVQLVAWLVALGFLLRPLLTRHSDDQLALWIERKTPSLRQRLIAAAQLNRPGADTSGMSPDLIAAVTRQAERQAGEVNLTEVCDSSRLKNGLLVAAGPLVLAGLALLLAPATTSALLIRLFGGSAEIPRSVRLAQEGRDVWPANEEGILRFRVEGKLPPESTQGVTLIRPEIGPSFRVTLSHEKNEGDAAIYAARVPPSDVPFTCLAWLSDGRLREAGHIRYAPRPVVTSIQAWVQLPEKILGKRRDGSLFEEMQKAGDIAYQLPGSVVRIIVTSQTNLTSAALSIRGTAGRQIPLTVSSNTASGTFALRDEDAGYEIALVNDEGFANVDVPRRSIRKMPLQLPEVRLLPETFWREGDPGSPEEREVEGIPILRTDDPKIGRRFRLEYGCEGRYGLSHARIRYRVIQVGKGADGEEGKINQEEFLVLPIGPPRDKKQKPTEKALIEFSTLPPRSEDDIPDTEGRGRYDFSIDGIPDGKGGNLQLREGDRIQFYVEVFSKADPDGTPGRSAIREKEVVGFSAYTSWLEKKDDLKERTRLLEEQQREVRPGSKQE